ncbi:MAG TPA: prenyltransferase/squalene oxidase repeat-containing protein, partial [Kofleriaceae bacterium]|nr:prenyltransferase/squalene oxidase repeat-containing protein [Kofleriaceae bacterium]
DVAATLLRARPQIKTMPRITEARIQVDVVAGHAPLGDTEVLMSALALPGVASLLALNPGVDGIGAKAGDKTALVLPHELVLAKLLSTKRPSETMGDFAMGVDLDRIASMVGVRLGGKVERGALFRFRTDAFVEQPAAHRDVPPLQLYRGIPPAPKLSADSLRTAALAGAHYLVAHLAPNGRYVYEHDLTTGVKSDPTRAGAYSMPRHGGTTYFLAQVYRITKQEWLREPIERAFAHLVGLMKDGGCATTLADGTEVDCVLDKGEHDAQLGSTALVVVALAEYELATGDTRYRALATKLSNWLLFMQRPDGSFRHLYNPVTRVADDKSQLLYYSGEAALALTRMYVVTKEPRYVQAAERALDWLVDWYDFFMGGFIFGEEHWTCIAAEAIYPAVQKPKYREFCESYGAFLRQQQPERGEHPDEDDLVGAYTVTPFVPPYNTPAGSRTEAMISAYLLGVHEGIPDEALRAQIAATLQYTLGQQIRPENDFDVVGDADGGMPGSPLERNVRIDYVQHVCSGMIRASEWIDGQPH